LYKSTHEIHDRLEGEEGEESVRVKPSLASVLIQIMLLDIVFSLDSVITAVGMAEDLGVMVTAVVIAVGFMMVFAAPVSGFVERHPTVKMLALSFLLLIGLTLIADGLGRHIPKGYIYFAMAFSVGVELLNLRMRKGKKDAVKLRQPYVAPQAKA
jgi:predicted tellurium resistance membrane protein TerC